MCMTVYNLRLRTVIPYELKRKYGFRSRRSRVAPLLPLK